MNNLNKINKIIDECYVDFVVPAKISFLDFKGEQDKHLFDALKGYCLENLILLNREQRDYCLKGLAKKCKEASKSKSEVNLRFEKIVQKSLDKKVLKEAEKTPLKEYKVLLSIRAFNEDDLEEQLNDFSIEWWCCCGE